MDEDKILNEIINFAKTYNLKTRKTLFSDNTTCFRLYEKHAPETEAAKLANSSELIALCIPSDPTKEIKIAVNGTEFYDRISEDLGHLGYELSKYR